MRRRRYFRQVVAGAVAVAVAGAAVVVGGVANAQTPDGTFTPDPSTGSDVTIITGLTNGICDVPGTAEAPVDGFNAVVSGPGAFAPDPAIGRPDGLAVVGTSDIGFSTTEPIPFTLRGNFRDLATELGTTIVPGDYVVTFRCVNQFDGIIYQRFSATFTFDTPTSYRVTNPLPASPSPSPVVSPTPEVSPSPTPEVSPTPVVSPTPEVSPSPTPEVSPTPVVSPTPEVSPSPTPSSQPGARDTTTRLRVIKIPFPFGLGGFAFSIANVAPGNAGGTVQLKNGDTNVGGPLRVIGGIAFGPVGFLPRGQHSLTAEFTPSNPAALKPSTSNTVTFRF